MMILLDGTAKAVPSWWHGMAWHGMAWLMTDCVHRVLCSLRQKRFDIHIEEPSQLAAQHAQQA